jgi:uncharacterized protein (DUF58 family)
VAAEERRLRYLDPEVVQKVGSLELVVREIVEGLRVGAHRSPLRGFSTDFAHHRPYVHGDALRHIDWRVYGRTERYYTKLYEQETNYEAYLLLDASSSMTYGSGAITKLEYAKYLAATLAYVVLKQRDSVGLGIFDGELKTYVRPQSAMDLLGILDEQLAGAGTRPRTDIGGQLHDFAERIPRRAVVLLFSDLIDDVDRLASGLDHLRFRGHSATVFHVLDPAELEFPFKGTWRFRGLENENAVTTQPERIRDLYLENLHRFLESVRTGCERSAVEYVQAVTSRSVEVVASEFLIHRMRSS